MNKVEFVAEWITPLEENRDDGIEPGGPCQEPCEGIVRRV